MLVLDVLLVGVVVEVSSPVWSSALHLMRTRYAKGAGRSLACTQIHTRDTEANVSFGLSVLQLFVARLDIIAIE